MSESANLMSEKKHFDSNLQISCTLHKHSTQWSKNILKNLISFCLKGDKLQFIIVTKFGVAWTDFKNKPTTTFDEAFLKPAVVFYFILVSVIL